MTRVQTWLLTICGCFACVAVGIFALQGREAIVAAENSSGGIGTKVNSVLDSANGTLADVNRPCKGPAGPDACGTLAQINKGVIATGDLLVTSQMQVKQSGLLIESATQNMNTVGIHVSEVADSLNQTAKATTTAVNQATMDLATANTTIASAQPLLTHLDAVAVSTNTAVLDFDAAERDPNWSAVLKNVAGMTATGDHMLVTADAVEDKLAACTLHPHFTCYLKSDLLFGAQAAGYLIR